jgi:hypothetical protein
MTLVSELIRSRINYVDEQRRKDILSERELEVEDLDDRSFCGHIHLGAPQCSTSLEQLENENKSNRAFGKFRKKLSTFLNHFLHAQNIPLPDGVTWLTVSKQDTVNIFVTRKMSPIY